MLEVRRDDPNVPNFQFALDYLNGYMMGEGATGPFNDDGLVYGRLPVPHVRRPGAQGHRTGCVRAGLAPSPHGYRLGSARRWAMGDTLMNQELTQISEMDTLSLPGNSVRTAAAGT